MQVLPTILTKYLFSCRNIVCMLDRSVFQHVSHYDTGFPVQLELKPDWKPPLTHREKGVKFLGHGITDTQYSIICTYLPHSGSDVDIVSCFLGQIFCSLICSSTAPLSPFVHLLWSLWTISFSHTFSFPADPCPDHRAVRHTVRGWLLPLPVPLPPRLPHSPTPSQAHHHWTQHCSLQPQLLPQRQGLPQYPGVSRGLLLSWFHLSSQKSIKDDWSYTHVSVSRAE